MKIMIDFTQYDTFLFDLDGTLIDINPQVYLTNYVELAYSYFQDLNVSLQDFKDRLLLGTKFMLENNDPEKTPLQVFKEQFAQLIGLSELEVWDRFSRFYDGKYDELRSYIHEFPGMPQVIKTLRDHDKTLVLATNPVFPLNAVIKRIRWGGLNEDWFQLITHAENTIWCKPNPKYYEKILKDINAKSEDSIMIGNDLMNDVSAKILGIKTVLLSDNQTNGEFEDLGEIMQPDVQLTVREFTEIIAKQYS